MQFSRESLLSANRFGFFHGRLAAAGGYPNRLWARTRTLVAAAAVAGLALPGTAHHCREHSRCSVGEPSTFTRFVGRSGVSSVIAARARERVPTAEARAGWRDRN